MTTFSYTHPRNILVATLQRLYDYGMTTTSGGNISLKDDDGNIWITPGGIDKGSLRPEDIVKVTPDGKVIGIHRPSCELPFHAAVYSRRHDVRAVLHAHSPALVAFSMIGACPDPTLVPGSAEVCGKVTFSHYDIPGSASLGRIIAAEFERGADSVMMENHGAVMCGRTIAEAFRRFETLDYIARIQINASGLQSPLIHPAGFPQHQEWPEFEPTGASPEECELRDQIVNLRHRAYRQKLLFSGSAYLSARLGEDDFLITPTNFDPMSMNAGDMVRVRQGRRESGKIPGSGAAYCREFYRSCPWANAIIMTRPPHAMAFATTATPIDSRTIPESYIQLRDMPMLSSEEYFASPKNALKYLSPAHPVLLVENSGVITFGKTLLEAFDRLEVAEFTAKCLLLASRIGSFRPIGEKQVEAIIEAFHLPVDEAEAKK